jgi:imidazole glycerol-phosphate synthase subunit HisH
VSAPITIVDYGIGNIGSIQNMLKKIGARSVVASKAKEILEASKLILPGVGAFDAGMETLAASGLVDALNHKAVEEKTPVLGLCLGMQLMTRGSEEGVLPGLGWVRAETVKFNAADSPGLKIPHMGWNFVEAAKESPILKGYPADARFYFVHSYYVRCEDRADPLLRAAYGSTFFDAGFQHQNLFGVQFHPEKSHRYGMWLLKNFTELC